MAVPKKRTSKSKKNQRKHNWKKKVFKQSEKYNAITQLKTFKTQNGLLNKNKKKGFGDKGFGDKGFEKKGFEKKG